MSNVESRNPIYGGYDFNKLLKQIFSKYNIELERAIVINETVPKKDMVNIYNLIDLFLTTTSGEGWGMTNIESALCKIPIIMPRTTSIEEIFGNLYEGYFDTDLAWDSGVSYTNASFTSNIDSTWIPLGQTMSAALLKNMILVLEGGSGAILYLKWYKDFGMTPSSITSIELRPATTGSTSLWGASTSRYGTTTVAHTHDATLHPSNSLYSPIFGLQEYKTPLTGSAKHLKFSLAIESNGYDASIQDLSLLHKEGKIR